MPVEKKPIIAIVGAGKCSKKLRDNAATVARYIVKNGGVVVCGGLEGIMEGAARGAWEGGGRRHANRRGCRAGKQLQRQA